MDAEYKRVLGIVFSMLGKNFALQKYNISNAKST